MENDNTFGGCFSREFLCVNAATIDANYRRELASRKAFDQPGLDIESFIVVKHQLWLRSVPFLNNDNQYLGSQSSRIMTLKKPKVLSLKKINILLVAER